MSASLREELLAAGKVAALEGLTRHEQAGVAAPYQRLGVVRLARQRVGDQLHGAVEGNGIAVHAGEHVLAHLEVEALLGERAEAHGEDQQQQDDRTHG